MHTHSNITHTASKLTHKCCETQECVRSLHCSRVFNRRPELWSIYIRIEIHLKCMLCFYTFPHIYTSMQHTLPKGITNDQICVCIYCLAGWQHGTGQWWRRGTVSGSHGSLPFDEAAHRGGTRPKVTHKHNSPTYYQYSNSITSRIFTLKRWADRSVISDDSCFLCVFLFPVCVRRNHLSTFLYSTNQSNVIVASFL